MPASCARLRVLVDARDTDLVACDVGALAADLVAVEALTRLQLTARRLGCNLCLRHTSRELDALLALCGLEGVLPAER